MPKSRKRKRKNKTHLHLPDRAIEILRDQQKRFREKFGRDPGPGDPVFFDSDADEPQSISVVRMQAETLDAMRKANAPQEVIYAYKKTGLLYVEGMSVNWPADRVQEWNDAIAEYQAIEDAKATKPAGWDTEIPELLVAGMEQADLDQVHDCLKAMAPVEGSRPMRLASRIELAAYVAVGALDHAFDAAHGTGHPENADQLFEMAADLIIRRARELYARGPAPEAT